MSDPSEIKIDLQFWQGQSTTSSSLFDNGKAQVAVTVFYSVKNATVDDIGLDICPRENGSTTTVSTMNREPGSDFPATFACTAAPEGVYVPTYEGHDTNNTLTPGVNFTSSEKTFFLSTDTVVSSNIVYMLMAYVKLSNYVAGPGASTENGIYIYSYMDAKNSFNMPVQFLKNVSLTVAHKPALDLTCVESTGTDHDFTDQNFDRNGSFIHMYFIKAMYTGSSLTFELFTNSASAKTYLDHSSNEVDTQDDMNVANKDVSLDPGGTGMGGFSCENYARHAESRLTRLMSNACHSNANVEQLNIDPSAGQNATYHVFFDAPYIGSFAYYYVDHVQNNTYHEFSGMAKMKVTDVYGSCSEITIKGNIGSNNDDNHIDIDSSYVEHIVR